MPAPDGSIARNVAFAEHTARDCAARSGDLLPFITTANTARDMDAIRAVLGEPRLSYHGLSYGSYLGAVYVSLFPQHTDRIILDSAVDPARVWYEQWRTWSLGFALRLPDFTGWAAARDATYHLGATPEAVHRTYVELTARLDRDPIKLPDGSVISGNLLRLATFDSLYSDLKFPTLAQTWQRLVAGGVPADLAARRLGRPGLGAALAVPADNLHAAEWAVLCGDVAWPREIDTYAHNVAVDRRLFPDTAGFPANLLPCAFWPHRPVEAPVKVTDRGPRNVLILQNLRDPATPWISGRGLRQALGQRAAMVSVDQGGARRLPVARQSLRRPHRHRVSDRRHAAGPGSAVPRPAAQHRHPIADPAADAPRPPRLTSSPRELVINWLSTRPDEPGRGARGNLTPGSP